MLTKYSILIVLQDLPQKMEVELISDDSFTNALLIANILVTIVVSVFASRYVQKKIKEYEVKAHRDKIITEKKIDFCLHIHKTFKSLCIKNPSSITIKDLAEVNSLKISENNLFINQQLINKIDDFGDYIINISQSPSSKDFDKEKFFFHGLKEYLKK